MPSLPTDSRNFLERTVVTARDEAEKAARAALIRLAVHQCEPYTTLSEQERSLRNRLRAEARRLGESPESQKLDKQQPYPALVAEVAYAQWHRMLFARFLAENGLLMHPEGVAVTLGECAELAAGEGEPDGWMLAARYAARMLPGIFRQDDPVTQVRFDAAGRLALERLLNELPVAIFTADDSLGWVYQFWQTKRKKEVNESGAKVGGADIAPVSQLFTEHYMVQFLLHNSLGAWWAARHPGEALPTDLDYLRRSEDGKPAAGPFSAWPQSAAELRVLDPCCGSGHFLVAAFTLLRRFRMMEEGMSDAEAGDAVLQSNLFGLELDPRCTQIAVFALALAAWKAGGYRELPLPNVACSGLPVGQNSYEFTHLADGDQDTEATLRHLHRLFQQAGDLGSLIDPERVVLEEDNKTRMASLFAQRWEEISERMDRALSKERGDDPAAAIFGATAAGVARVADFLTRRYNLVATNVPYLARGKQAPDLRKHIEDFHNDAKADLATAFVDRCLRFCAKGGTVAAVTPQNWLFLGSYKALRERLLKTETWNVVAKLGPQAFTTPMFDYNIGMFVLTNVPPKADHMLVGLDVSAPRVPADKAENLRRGPLHRVSQTAQLENPDFRIAFTESDGGTLLNAYAGCIQGLATGDDPQFTLDFWELPNIIEGWEPLLGTVRENLDFGGRERILHWEGGTGRYYEHAMRLKAVGRLGGWKSGTNARGENGILVSQMSRLPCTLYTGEFFDHNASVIIPHKQSYLGAIWAYCSSPDFGIAVRRIDQSLKPTNATLVKVPFDLAHCQKVAEEQYPNGLPEPHSNDPTQWLFHGHPARSTNPLHVAAARLLGYRWPQNEEDGLDRYADADGIVCLPPVAGEQPAAPRLRELLAAAYGADWSPALEERLLAGAGFGGRGLEEWLREGFFARHCSLFHNRPFLWHIWDGHKEGFSAIVNYHRLTRQNLERLIYSYAQSWINAQRDADSRGIAGANARLVAALALQEKLKAIADGEPPYDIYVRWKPLHKQAIGWEPDINDGVRLNVRPFVTAGILRSKFSVSWNKDRGTNPDGTERLNDLHYTREKKEAARKSATGDS
jgi:hypothetical protein